MESDGSFAANVSRLLASSKARCTASYEYLRSETDASGGGGVMPSRSRGSRSAEARRSSCSLAAAEECGTRTYSSTHCVDAFWVAAAPVRPPHSFICSSPIT